MGIGLSGAHRTGKSTLAKRYAQVLKIPYIATSASATFARLGLDPKADYQFATRLEIQKEILNDCAALYRAAPGRFITDRTPLDFMAYLLADARRQNVSEEEGLSLIRYMDDCYRVANAHFSVIVVVRPGIQLVEAEGKAPANPAYVAHIDSLVVGLGFDGRYEGVRYYIPSGVTELEERVKCVRFAEETATQRQMAFLSALREERGELAVH